MNSTDSRKDQLFLIGIVASMMCWGLSWASGKVLSEYGGALTISFFRFIVTFVSLFVFLLFLRQKLTIQRDGLIDLLASSFFIGLYVFLFFKGLSTGKAGAGGVLVTVLNPIVSYGIMLAQTQRRPTKNETIGLLIGIIAGTILLQVWDHWDKLWNAGNIYFLLASFSWAVLSIFTSKSARYGSPVTFSLWMYGICSLVLLLITDHKEKVYLLSIGDSLFWWNIFFSAAITTTLATTFYFVATSRLGASKASSFIFLVPFSAALGSWIFLNEVPEMHTIVGGILGIGAVYILNKK
jgi:drug/metabolite transporter (DMT)-like permease